MHEDLSGSRIGSYQLLSRLGAGGMGEVYLAHDVKLDRRVAIKFLSSEFAADPDRIRRFHQEARAASSLNHPHIVVVHDFGELAGRPYMVTEFIEGETLRRRLQHGRLPIREVVDIGLQIASALAAAHARGLVHRDIKPENVMIRGDGYVKVLDFGLAKFAIEARWSDQARIESHTQSGMVIGTPRYMSPEQARGLEIDVRSDVWSLGAVLYELATGELPFADSSAVTVAGVEGNVTHTEREGASRDIPPELLRIISKALETVRDRRYQNAGELFTDLKHVERETASVRSGVFGARTRVLAAVTAIALGAVVTALWMRNNGAVRDMGVQTAVAVLPFENLGGDGAIDYLRLALADEVATSLSSTPSLAVRPIASSRRFAGGAGRPQDAGRELRVGRIVTGHFSLQQSELRVTVEAVDVDSDRLLWRGTITVAAADSIALRDGLTALIGDGLLPALDVAKPIASQVRPRNADAYAGYLKSLAISSDPGPNREAIAMLQRVSSMEPDYADAWGRLSTRYYYDSHYGGGGAEALRRAEAAARHALTLDPNHAAAAVLLFNLQVEAGRLQDGYDSAMKLVKQRPDSGEARFALSYVLRYGGLLEESARECEQAVSRDPTNPLFRSCAQPFMILGRYDRALDFVRLDSGSEWARVLMRVIYQRMGRRDDALKQHQQLAPEYLRGLAPAAFHGLLARCLSGTEPGVQGQLSADDVKSFLTAREDPEPLYFWAGDLAYCGYTAASVTLLRESVRRNYCAVSAIEIDSMFAAIRNHAGYGELLDAARACRTRFSDHVRTRMRSP